MNTRKSTIPRGYRLKESTHKLIKRVQEELNSSQDKVIARAVRLYYKTIKSDSGNNLNKVSMKLKILVILICNLLICNLLIAQNITNTLGTSGVFTIKDASNDYLTLNQTTGQVNLLKSLRLEYTTSSTLGVIFKGADRFIHNYGTENTFLGINAGNFTMTGYQNTSVGNFSLNVNTTGFENTAEGNYSLRSNTSGSMNTAVGYASLYSNASGNSNTALGWKSLYTNATGYENTALGQGSLLLNTIGSTNTAVGYHSLYFNTTGRSSTAVGHNSLVNNTTGENNTALGFGSLFSNSSGNNNTALGVASLSSNTTGFNNTALGDVSGTGITTGDNLTCIGYNAQPTSVSASNEITLGDGFVTSLRCNVTTITSLSDARDKKNISNLSLGLDFITKLRPRQFNWDKREWYEDNTSDGSKKQVVPTAGFVAQELDEVQTTENAEWLNLVLKDNPEKWEATPGNLLPIMVKAIQELKSENDELKKEVEELKTVKEKLAELEQIVNEIRAVKNVSLTNSK